MADYLQKQPLYQAELHASRINLFQPKNSKGLLFDRLFGGYEVDWKVDKIKQNNGDNKHPLSWLEGQCGEKELLEKSRDRQLALISALNGTGITAKLDWHMVTGIGEAHPLENGFRWHHNLGTPYLPASSIKGMLRTYLTQWSPESFSQEELLTIFGHEQESSAEQAGQFLFFDAIPIESPVLILDVMTPHCADWYEKGGITPGNAENVPADWQSPVPIHFLAVKTAAFLFTLAPRQPQNQELLNRLINALSDALSTLGIGAKTASGYGVMQPITNSSVSFESLSEKIKIQRQKDREKLENANRSPEGKLIYALESELKRAEGDKQKESLNAEIGKLVEQAENWSLTDRSTLASLIEQNSRWLHISDNKKKKQRKDKLAQLKGNKCVD